MTADTATPSRAQLEAQRAQYAHDLAWAQERRRYWMRTAGDGVAAENVRERRQYWARRIDDFSRGLAELDRQLAALQDEREER